MAIELTDSNFNEIVLTSKQIVIVDFGAEWCGPCKKLEPVIEELAKENQGKAVIAKIDVDKNPETAVKYGIMSIPTLIFFEDGHIKEQLKGFVSKSTLQAKLEGYAKVNSKLN